MDTPETKIAYLILAHNQPAQLARMIERLDHEAVEFFIHIDKKSDIGPFLNLLGGRARVNFIDKRHKIYWKGFSQILATLALMRKSLACKAEYYILLSGTDYPLKSNNEILQFFNKNNTQYIHYFSLHDIPKWFKKIRYYYYWDSPLTNQRQGIKAFKWRYMKYVQRNILDRMPARKYMKEMQPYGGSQWWMLTYECLKYCLDFLENNVKFRTFYRFTDSPDEMVFQTIILNSHFAGSAINYKQYQDNREFVVSEILRKPLGSCKFNLRYIDWYSPERGFPAALNDSNFDEMTGADALFARKFDPVVSGSLLEKIDRELLL